MGRLKIFPSLLAADFSCLADEIKRVEQAGADGIHLDVMDGHFVPNISFGPPVIRSLRKITDMEFWAHLMIEEPGRYLKDYVDAGVQGITVHAEIDEDAAELSKQIHDFGLKAGISINPETPANSIFDLLEYFELLLVMTVHPGFGGQSFMPEPVKKITEIKNECLKTSHQVVVEVDGGINDRTAPIAAAAGADILVAGSSVFHAENPVEAVQKLRLAAESALR